MQVFHFLLSLHHPNTCFENISNFLFAPLQLKSQKLFLGRKNIGGREAFATLAPPSYAYDDDCDDYDDDNNISSRQRKHSTLTPVLQGQHKVFP
jgi:hypothetical protein